MSYYTCQICNKQVKRRKGHKDSSRKFCNKCQPKADRMRRKRGQQKYYAAHPHKKYSDHIRRKYKMTLEQYDKMFKEQNGVCAICGGSQFTNRLSVDHNHETGEVRGLLCSTCNPKLGIVEDKDFIKKALSYLGQK